MEPIGHATECMDIYHKNEYPENLNPRLQRQWLTASIIDDIAHNLISKDILKIYSSQEDDTL